MQDRYKPNQNVKLFSRHIGKAARLASLRLHDAMFSDDQLIVIVDVRQYQNVWDNHVLNDIYSRFSSPMIHCWQQQCHTRLHLQSVLLAL